MRRKLFVLAALAALASLILAACSPSEPAAEPTDTPAPADESEAEPTQDAEPEPAGDPVEIRWFVGLGTGGNPEQIDAQNAIVDAFNASQDGINLTIEIVENDVAFDTLSTQIAAGNAPDLVGPVGIRGANSFNGRWLDLEPLVESSGYDLSRFAEEQVDAWRTDEGLVAIPFGVFPAVMFYNKALFDEAGLPYPPAAFGEDYDGKPWDIDTMTELARQLTVDANGNDATGAEFDPENIVQFGLEEQWSEPQRLATWFGAASIAQDGKAVVPDEWRDAFNWYYEAIWSDHAIPNDEYRGSDLLAAGNPFDSGNVAMAHTHLWYQCCLTNVTDWDLAVVPSYNGTTTAALHADVFRILNTTEHPDEAFEVLAYLTGEAAPDLLESYGAMPADPALSDEFFARLAETYPGVENWDVATASLEFPDIPSHEQDMPNFLQAQERFSAFFSELGSTPDLDVDSRIDALEADLQQIFDASS
ncbi:MAG TPA: extracellular solute-binding protein [Egibacteraceae bacterium]|nr:extracellular solute-binding protein [Egibacteraceae bacterium]